MPLIDTLSWIDTARSSPVRPTSPKLMTPSGSGLSRKLDAIASTIGKSTAGSSSRMPPTTLTYTSPDDRNSPQRFPEWRAAAPCGCSPRRQRCGAAHQTAFCSKRLHLGEQRTAALHHAGNAVAGRTLRMTGQHSRRRILHLEQTVIAHFKHADFIG